MANLLSVPFSAYIAETAVLRFKEIQPPDYWLTLRDVEWLDVPPVIGDSPPYKPHPSLLASQETNSARLWSPVSKDGRTREQNTAEYTVSMKTCMAWVIKASRNMARQSFMAEADIRHVMYGQGAWDRPGYTGQNDWGLTTINGVIVREPVDVGMMILWGEFEIEYRSPLKG